MCAATINFISRITPGLEAGTYDLTVTQDILQFDTGSYFESPVVQTFHVDAPQFVLPATDILAQVPPANANGDFGQELPQIQLDRATLPWERAITQDTTVPWMALIVLREGEVLKNPTTNTPLWPTTVAGLSSPASNVYFPSVTPDALAEAADTPVQTVVLTPSVFRAVMPLPAELSLLCHCRNLAQSDLAHPDADYDSTTAVVVANRFPDASPAGDGALGSRNHCFLVSLEGYYDLLAAGATLPVSGSGNPLNLQLVVLSYWSFVAAPAAEESFAEAMQAFVREENGHPQNLLLRLPVTTPQNPSPSLATAISQATARLNQGYVPLAYQTGVGQTSMAWYRGPLSPVVPQPLPVDGMLAESADAVTIYSETESVFDLSYASAWQMGRMLALADSKFAADLLAFRQASYRVLDLLMDRLESDAFDTPEDLQDILDSNVIYDAFDTLIGEGIADAITDLNQDLVNEVQTGTVDSTTTTTPTDPLSATVAFLQQPEVVDALSQAVAQDLMPVANWLAKLQLLKDVPFHQLVPDQRMLPQETIRFFILDQNWVDCLMGGAKSVGLESSKDSFFYQAMRDVIDDAVTQAVQVYRVTVAGTSMNQVEADSTKQAMSGVLIRSAVVHNYPDMQVHGYSNGTLLKTLRMERLSDSVMLVLFLDIADSLKITQSHDSMQLGVEDHWVIWLRGTSGDQLGVLTGDQFPATGDISQYYRATSSDIGAQVLNLNDGTNTCLKTALQTTIGVPVDAAMLALQLVKSPEALNFFSQSLTFYSHTLNI